MSITLGGTTLLSAATHQLPSVGDFNYEPQDIEFYGVPGSVSIDDALHNREITIDAILQGYTPSALLDTALYILDALITTFNDRSLVVVGSSTLTFVHCSFRGFRRRGRAFSYHDGSGTVYWRQDGTFVFEQLKRTP